MQFWLRRATAFVSSPIHLFCHLNVNIFIRCTVIWLGIKSVVILYIFFVRGQISRQWFNRSACNFAQWYSCVPEVYSPHFGGGIQMQGQEMGLSGHLGASHDTYYNSPLGRDLALIFWSVSLPRQDFIFCQKHLEQAFFYAVFHSHPFNETFIVKGKSHCCNDTFTDVRFIAKNI